MQTPHLNLSLLFSSVFIISLFLFNQGWQKEGDFGSNDNQEQVQADINVCKGNIGFRINLRELVEQGQEPYSIKTIFSTKEEVYDRELMVDSFTSIAQLSISLNELSSNSEAELRNGVPLTVEILNEKGDVILTEFFNVVALEEQSTELNINNAALECIDKEFLFKQGIRPIIKVVQLNENLPCWTIGKGKVFL